jgi:hypothetical protein
LELPRDIGIDEKDWKYTLGQLLHQSDMLAPAESTAWYGTDDYAELHEEVIVPYVRHKLDTDGLGEKLLERSRRSGPFLYTYYQTIVLAAVMMRAGAKIKPEHLLYQFRPSFFLLWITTSLVFRGVSRMIGRLTHRSMLFRFLLTLLL